MHICIYRWIHAYAYSYISDIYRPTESNIGRTPRPHRRRRRAHLEKRGVAPDTFEAGTVRTGPSASQSARRHPKCTGQKVTMPVGLKVPCAPK